jgi:hypothetical protein
MKGVVAAARLLAKARQSAVRVVGSYDIRHDPEETFAIVPMRVVGEEIIQAVGYGRLGAPPQVVVEHHALSRRTAFLIPFANALDEYLTRAVDLDFPRIYIANAPALELLTVMAARYENAGRNLNPNPALRPSHEVVRLGYLCRLIKDIYHMPGQQIVVVMTEAIRRHFVTGQIPPKDGHLGALTEWLAAVAGATGTQARADLRALHFPAAAMLSREDDEAVESILHKIKKSKSALTRQRLQADIEHLQAESVLAEWSMLQEAHAAFWGRDLDASVHPDITKQNTSWLKYRLEVVVARSRRAIAMSQRYEMHEYHAGLHKSALIAQDSMRFEHERVDGNAFRARISAVRKTPRGVQPKDHQIDLTVDHQPNIRLRLGHRVQIVGGELVGEVRMVKRTPVGYDATLSVLAGIDSAAIGGPHRWADQVPGKPFTQKYYDKIKSVLGMS